MMRLMNTTGVSIALFEAYFIQLILTYYDATWSNLIKIKLINLSAHYRFSFKLTERFLSRIAPEVWAQKKGDVGKLCTTENTPWETIILFTNLLRGKRERKPILTTHRTSRPHHQTIPKPSNSLSELRSKVK